MSEEKKLNEIIIQEISENKTIDKKLLELIIEKLDEVNKEEKRIKEKKFTEEELSITIVSEEEKRISEKKFNRKNLKITNNEEKKLLEKNNYKLSEETKEIYDYIYPEKDSPMTPELMRLCFSYTEETEIETFNPPNKIIISFSKKICGIRHGLRKYYDYYSGFIRESIEFKFDQMHGAVKNYDHFYENNFDQNKNFLSRIYYFKNGLLDGKSIYYDSFGKVTSTCFWKNDSRYGMEIIYFYFPKIKIIRYHINSKYAIEKKFYENGKPKSLEIYKREIYSRTTILFHKSWINNIL